MATRSTRNQPFCWQEKKILRLLKKQFKKSDLVKFKSLYLNLTEIDSDFNGQPIKFYTKTIATYSGLSEKWIPQALQKLRELNILEIHEERDGRGRISGRELIFTPEKVVSKPNSSKPNIRKPDSRSTRTLEDSSSLEDSINKEDRDFVNEEKLVDETPFDLELFKIENDKDIADEISAQEMNGRKRDLSLKKEVLEIILYFNEFAEKKIQVDPVTSSTAKPIKARLREGYTVEQCKQVIRVKSEQWKNDNKMKKYLRPVTLFSDKFESYLIEGDSRPKSREELELEKLRS